jgi:aminopeptidase YwaD
MFSPLKPLNLLILQHSINTLFVRILYTTLFSLTLLAASQGFAQSKTDKKIIKELKTDIEYLASDELEGRRTGTEGERKASDYIIKRYEKLKVKPYKGKYKHGFQFIAGKEIGKSEVTLGEETLKLGKQDFPLPFSGNGAVDGDVLVDVHERHSIWIMPLYASQEEANDAHFDWEKTAFDKTRAAVKDGAAGIVFFDGYGAKFAPEFNHRSDYESIGIPVVFIGNKTWKELVDEKSSVFVKLEVALKKTERTGNNVAAFIDNKAKYTVVLGAHYDHLGYGEDGSSLYGGKEKQIHNGADDNASGTAALIHLAGWLKSSSLKNYNYLFVNFSGEELGLFGSKAFAKEEGIDSNDIAYMLNMDMVGRLNDSSRALTLGGVGTSPMWADLVTLGNKTFRINTDSSGVGPSDHSSFYNKGIPVLFFFTGSHHDYHKPSDDADKINYPGEVDVIRFIQTIVTKMDNAPRPKFTPTKQTTVGKARFKVTLGIMPDYSYQDAGVRVDGVADGKPAQKAGIIAGDIVMAIGDDKVQGMQSYMETLGKQKEGGKTTVTILRNGKEMKLPITFK